MPSTKVRRNNSETSGKSSDDVQLTDRVEYEELSQDDGIPEEIIFPEELNKFLREQIRNLSSENGCLRRSLEESEEKLRELRNKTNSSAESGRGLFAGGKAGDNASSRIVELSKKLRDQTAEIEVLRTRCKTLESKLAEKNRSEEGESEARDSCGDGDRFLSLSVGSNDRPLTLEDELKNREDEIKVLKEKLSQTNSKLYDSKNTCTSLRQEVNKAQKLLCSEVGDNVTISGLSFHQSGWRGRAEQIQQLQKKIVELNGRLSDCEGSSKGGSSGGLPSTGVTSTEKRQANSLRNIEKERRQKAEDLAKELRETNAAVEVHKRKLDAAKARIKVLENDLTIAKQSVALLNEKRSHDEQLIEALNGQLGAIEEKYREREREITVGKERAEKECLRICSEMSKLRSANDRLQRSIEEKETEVEALRNEGTVVKNGIEGEERPPISRGRNYASPSGACGGNGVQNEYVIISMAAEAERERLMELVAVLNRRLDEERRAGDTTSERLRVERSKLARMETRLQRLEMERVGMSKVNTGYKPRFAKSSQLNLARFGEEFTEEETRFKIELLEEECLALRTRLATVERDKASDLAAYKQMLDQARKTFQDAYRGKSNSYSYSAMTI